MIVVAFSYLKTPSQVLKSNTSNYLLGGEKFEKIIEHGVTLSVAPLAVVVFRAAGCRYMQKEIGSKNRIPKFLERFQSNGEELIKRSHFGGLG